ncbi:hypothetical protein ACO22_01218 [Paracoccidioides brasiliensis]|uniref:Uncharacterized protein n=1 Tax=Paracoccidioides brasiliensis TaxID=121759 RepID=A0A1D2JM38_PARBR|nr:hypothetical protein ACO22_01218 [Paracoccidioides brasiliensis]
MTGVSSRPWKLGWLVIGQQKTRRLAADGDEKTHVTYLPSTSRLAHDAIPDPENRSSVGPWHFLNYFSCRPQPNKESAAGAHCPQGLHSKPDRHQEHTRGLSLLSSPGIDRAQPGRTSAHTKGTSTQDSNHVSWTT